MRDVITIHGGVCGDWLCILWWQPPPSSLWPLSPPFSQLFFLRSKTLVFPNLSCRRNPRWSNRRNLYKKTLNNLPLVLEETNEMPWWCQWAGTFVNGPTGLIDLYGLRASLRRTLIKSNLDNLGMATGWIKCMICLDPLLLGVNLVVC